MAGIFVNITSLCCGSYLLSKQFVTNSDPKFTKKDAAIFFIANGIWNFVLTVVWKKGVETLQNEDLLKENEKEELMDPKVPHVIRAFGLLYASVGYFGYIKGYKSAYYLQLLAIGLPYLLGGSALLMYPKRLNFMTYIRIFDIIKATGFLMMFKEVPLK
eukprot:419680_1